MNAFCIHCDLLSPCIRPAARRLPASAILYPPALTLHPRFLQLSRSPLPRGKPKTRCPPAHQQPCARCIVHTSSPPERSPPPDPPHPVITHPLSTAPPRSAAKRPRPCNTSSPLPARSPYPAKSPSLRLSDFPTSRKVGKLESRQVGKRTRTTSTVPATSFLLTRPRSPVPHRSSPSRRLASPARARIQHRAGCLCTRRSPYPAYCAPARLTPPVRENPPPYTPHPTLRSPSYPGVNQNPASAPTPCNHPAAPPPPPSSALATPRALTPAPHFLACDRTPTHQPHHRPAARSSYPGVNHPHP